MARTRGATVKTARVVTDRLRGAIHPDALPMMSDPGSIAKIGKLFIARNEARM